MVIFREWSMRPPKIGRPGISSLRSPSPRFDLTNTPNYETAQGVAEEDRCRAAMLRRRALTAKPRQARALGELADAIDPDVTAMPKTAASSRYMRDQRIRIIGGLWELLSTTCLGESHHSPQPPISTFTAIPEDWSVPEGQLHQVIPARLMQAFRGHLNRVMASMENRPDGMLFAGLHGAYDPTTRTYPLHVHGVATGGMIEVVNGLRKLRKYKPAQPGDGRDAANTPVLMSRKPLTNMPDPLTYLLQRWWPKRETYIDTDGSRKAFGGSRKRITGPAYGEYLTFLDRWEVKELILLMGMHVTRQGLVARQYGSTQ